MTSGGTWPSTSARTSALDPSSWDSTPASRRRAASANEKPRPPLALAHSPCGSLRQRSLATGLQRRQCRHNNCAPGAAGSGSALTMSDIAARRSAPGHKAPQSHWLRDPAAWSLAAIGRILPGQAPDARRLAPFCMRLSRPPAPPAGLLARQGSHLCLCGGSVLRAVGAAGGPPAPPLDPRRLTLCLVSLRLFGGCVFACLSVRNVSNTGFR
jgi:hypothetical protein